LIPQSLSLVSTRAFGDPFVPHYLTERDHPWLRTLLDEHARFVGRRRTELRARMQEPLPVLAPKAKLRIAAHVLDRLSRDHTESALVPREARWEGAIGVRTSAQGFRSTRVMQVVHVKRHAHVTGLALSVSIASSTQTSDTAIPFADNDAQRQSAGSVVSGE
jgi:hypothetical protein